MVTRRRYLVTAGVLAVAGCASEPEGTSTADGAETDGVGETPGATETGGATGGSPEPAETDEAEPLVVSSSAFEDGGTIPKKYTGAGEDVSPPLTVESVPEGASTLAVVLEDPDANGYVHWLIWNVPADRTEIPEGVPQTETVDSLGGARQGTNNFGEIGYRGPLPPKGDGPHTYRFTVYAVDGTLDLAAGAGRGKLGSALEGRVVDRYRFTAEFER
ncbi:MAG: YbhB/YbcL family Raf kinase inhibitor-like protein [Halosimplex sp.]